MGIGVWTEVAVETAGVPGTDIMHTNQMVYDPIEDLVLLYSAGGLQTSQWDGTVWTQITTGTQLGNPMLWFDEESGVPMSYGGSNLNTAFNKTYVWDWGTSAWVLQSPATSPSARQLAAIAYDSNRQEAIMFGGLFTSLSANAKDETWQWKTGDWTLLTPATVPTKRFGASMAYDPVRDEIVLFGGRSNTNVIISDTSTWDGTDWTVRSPATSPPAREDHAMAWDPYFGKVILYGGIDVFGTYYNDTWAWNGAAGEWEDITTLVTNPLDPPLQTYLNALTYYTSRRELTLLTCNYPPNNFVKGDTWVIKHGRQAQMIRWR